MKHSSVGFTRTALLALGLAFAAPSGAQTQGNVTFACDRACLGRIVDAYFAGLVANDPALVPLAPGAKLTLNDEVVAPGKLFWDQAASVQSRIDIANPRWGDTGTQAVINNADGSQHVYAFRLKVKANRITEVEAILVRNAQEGGLYDTRSLQRANPNFSTRIRPAEQDSYYDLVAAAEGYWRGVQHQRLARVPPRRVLARRAAAGERRAHHGCFRGRQCAHERGGAVRPGISRRPQCVGPALSGGG
jgi:hypothetical protein